MCCTCHNLPPQTVDAEIPKREQSKRTAFLRLLRGARNIGKQQK